MERHESPGVGQEIMVVQPNRHHDHDIRDEIHALEDERRALQLERRHDLVVDDENRDEVVEVRKDRKGRMSLVVPR